MDRTGDDRVALPLARPDARGALHIAAACDLRPGAIRVSRDRLARIRWLRLAASSRADLLAREGIGADRHRAGIRYADLCGERRHPAAGAARLQDSPLLW